MFMSSVSKLIIKDLLYNIKFIPKNKWIIYPRRHQLTCKQSFSTGLIIQQNSKIVSKSNNKFTKFLKYIGIGFGIGTIATGGYAYYLYKKVNTAILNESGNDYILMELPPKTEIARSIQNSADRTGLHLTLYQFQTCPFCCKVRAFLDYYGFSYDVIEVNSVTHKQTKWSSYKKVPFLVIEQPGSKTLFQLKDSSMIISALASYINNKNATLEEILKGYPFIKFTDEGGRTKVDILNKYSILHGQHPQGLSKEDILNERKWRKWVDDVFVHMISPNVYRTMKESFQSFEWFSKAGNWEELFSTWERNLVIYVGSLAMFLIGKKLKTKYGLKDDVRQSFYEETDIWLRAIRNSSGRLFMGGREPNLSDLGVYGVLTAIEGCDAFYDLMENTKINNWFRAMKDAVENHNGADYLYHKGADSM